MHQPPTYLDTDVEIVTVVYVHNCAHAYRQHQHSDLTFSTTVKLSAQTPEDR